MTDNQPPQNTIDFKDLQAELSGIPNGKASRFLDGETAPRNRHERERRARQNAVRTQLDQLLLNPDFAAAYAQAGQAIDRAQDKLNTAMEKIAARIEHLEEVLVDLEDSTAKLPDGTAVFRDQNGAYITKDGRTLHASETALLIDPENAQSYEQYKGAKDALTGARQKQGTLSNTQTKIDDARTRRDQSQTPEELEGIREDTEKIIAEIDANQELTLTFNQFASPDSFDTLRDLDLAVSQIKP